MGEAELGLGDHHHSKKPRGASCGIQHWPKNESSLGNLDAQNGLFLVVLCKHFVSSNYRKEMRVKGNNTQVLDLSCQIRELVSRSLSSTSVTKPLCVIHSFLPLPLLPSSFPVVLSVFLTTLNYLKCGTLPLFPLREQPWGLPSVCSTQPKGRREGPSAVCWPFWATTISQPNRSCKTCGLHNPASILQLIYSLGFEDHKKAKVTTQRSK